MHHLQHYLHWMRRKRRMMDIFRPSIKSNPLWHRYLENDESYNTVTTPRALALTSSPIQYTIFVFLVLVSISKE